MGMLRLWITMFLVYVMNAKNVDYSFAFGNTFGDNMVLQQAPSRAKVWGTSPTNESSVVVKLMLQSNLQVIQTVTALVNSDGVWSVYFDPQIASNHPYKITATMSNNATLSLVLDNVLFGDVFICSGQSNMQFTVDSAFN
eukprot:411126_1